MLEAKIHKEITEFEGKLISGLTGKQVICVVISVGISCALFFSLYKKLGIENTGTICMLAPLPILAFGFFKFRGFSFKDLIKILFNYYSKPQRKIYTQDTISNYYEEVEKIEHKRTNKCECATDTRYCFYAGGKKQLNSKRKSIRKHIAAYKKKYVFIKKAGKY
ncbi:hypothetical protein AGMMS50284_4690 [Clostridia bacterium]|nr:hypothetical protein AGMMS50284_4690 [Clostridia bacterium]